MPLQRTDTERLTLAYALVLAVIAALYRLAPYGWQYLSGAPAPELLWNLMPVGALALFAGSRLRTPYAYLLPVVVLFLSDLMLIVPIRWMTDGQYSAFGWGRPVIYASFAGYALLGRLVGPRERSPLVIGGAALLGGFQFFMVSNFAVWLFGTTYVRSFEGLAACYTMALPFYRSTVAADLICSGLFFAGHAALLAAAQRRPGSQPA